jgi:orotate phosphoribosyltransferase-like protein
MMSVKQIKEVRMMRQEGLPIREICRKACISRNTVRKILRGQQARFKYNRKPCIQPAQDSIKEIIVNWVKQDSLETRKYRRTAKRMYNLC